MFQKHGLPMFVNHESKFLFESFSLYFYPYLITPSSTDLRSYLSYPSSDGDFGGILFDLDFASSSDNF